MTFCAMQGRRSSLIEARYAIRYHPDRNPGDESAHAKFLEINQAYSILANDQSRREYDRSLDSDLPSSQRTRYTRTTMRAARQREPLRPEDWVQYKRSTSSGSGAGSRARYYDYAAHAKGHYADKAGDKRDRDSQEKSKAYFESIRREEK